MNFTFTKATKEQSRLRMVIDGPSGAGKTYTSLAIGCRLDGRVALIDTEEGSAAKYSDEFDFDTLSLPDHAPATYIAAMKAAEQAGYDVLIIDSASHEWMGRKGILEMHEAATQRMGGSKNSFAAWRDVTPEHNKFIGAILGSKCHVIATLRSKTEYQMSEGGKKLEKLGAQPIQREGFEYEFDIVGSLTLQHDLMITKTRCAEIDGLIERKPGADLAATLKRWLGTGDPVTPRHELRVICRRKGFGDEQLMRWLIKTYGLSETTATISAALEAVTDAQVSNAIDRFTAT